jgi:5-methyltetrahydropteroyltriglutamate--homocysteine methyltransferase
LDEAGLLEVGKVLKLNHWVLQKQLGVKHIPSNDFSFYDHVLDTAAMLGAVPERYTWRGPQVDLPTYFAMARGAARRPGQAASASHQTGALQHMNVLRNGV